MLRALEAAQLPALSSYRIVIECCVAGNQPEQAFQVLQSCIAKGLVPTIYSFELVVSALGKRGQWRRVRQLVDLMKIRLGMTPSVQIYNSLLQSCSRAKEYIVAKQVLGEMRKDAVPDVRSFNAVISACANAGQWKDALQVLDQCHREPSVQPDIYSYTNANIRKFDKIYKTIHG